MPNFKITYDWDMHEYALYQDGLLVCWFPTYEAASAHCDVLKSLF